MPCFLSGVRTSNTPPFIIDGVPQVQQPPADSDQPLIQVPRGLGFGRRIQAMAGPDFKTQCRSISQLTSTSRFARSSSTSRWLSLKRR